MNKILPNLYLGDWEDGKSANMSTMCVIERYPDDRYSGMTFYIPILEHDEYSLAHYPHKVNIEQLEEACEIITCQLEDELPILVHCYAGMERSPLTIAYWLVSTGRKKDLDEAYSFLKSIRPIVEDRREWLPKEVLKDVGSC